MKLSSNNRFLVCCAVVVAFVATPLPVVVGQGCSDVASALTDCLNDDGVCSGCSNKAKNTLQWEAALTRCEVVSANYCPELADCGEVNGCSGCSTEWEAYQQCSASSVSTMYSCGANVCGLSGTISGAEGEASAASAPSSLSYSTVAGSFVLVVATLLLATS